MFDLKAVLGEIVRIPWRATAPTLREGAVEFQMVWRPGDTVFDAIKAAFLSADRMANGIDKIEKNTRPLRNAAEISLI